MRACGIEFVNHAPRGFTNLLILRAVFIFFWVLLLTCYTDTDQYVDIHTANWLMNINLSNVTKYAIFF